MISYVKFLAILPLFYRKILAISMSNFWQYCHFFKIAYFCEYSISNVTVLFTEKMGLAVKGIIAVFRHWYYLSP
jgi:hypothetical protein